MVGFQQYARFEQHHPSDNRERFYLLAFQPTPLGEVALVRSWGRMTPRNIILYTGGQLV